jgi:hypothetical protein
MRIATWNVARCRPDGVRSERVLNLMDDIKADVWVLTETDRKLKPGPQYERVAYSADALDRDTKRGECWVAIWCKPELGAVQETLNADKERVAAVRLTGSGIVVVGTVLPWLSDTHSSGVRGEKAFCARLSEQRADWLRLKSGGLCVAGDFNQDLFKDGHYYGSEGGRKALREALIKCELDCLTGGDDDPLAGHAGLGSVDHIAVAGLRAVGKPRSTVWPKPGELNRRLLTDHYGVWSDVAQV